MADIVPTSQPTRTPLPRPTQPFTLQGHRIILFVNSIEMGGVEEHVRQLSVAFRAAGASVALICPEDPVVDPLADAVRQDGVEVLRLTLSLEAGVQQSIANLKQAVGFIRRFRPHVLHLHLTGYTGGRWILLAAKLAGVPTVVCTLQIVPESRSSLRLRLEWRVLNRSIEWVIAVSEITRQRLLDFLDHPAEKVVVIPNAVELDRYAVLRSTLRRDVHDELGIPEGVPVIGSVARLSRQKGLSYFLDALPLIRRRVPDVHVVLVGDGPLRVELETQAAQLGEAERVHFVGYKQDVPRWMVALDVFVLPSLFEGLPLSILEAMAAGLPVVATAVDGTVEAVDDGVTGALIQPRDPNAIASAVVTLLQDAALRDAQSRAARERSRQFSLQALVERVSGLYGVSQERRKRSR